MSFSVFPLRNNSYRSNCANNSPFLLISMFLTDPPSLTPPLTNKAFITELRALTVYEPG